MRLTHMPLGCLLLASVLVGVSVPAVAQPDGGGGWVEQPRELPVGADAAARTSLHAARGGAGTSLPLLLGGLATEWLAATHGLAMAAWVDAQSPAPSGNVLGRGVPAARISEALRVGIALPVGLAGLLLTATVAMGGVAAAAILVPMAAPVFLPMLVAGAVLLALGGGLLGAVGSIQVAQLLGGAAANEAFHAMWSRDAPGDPVVTPSPRPLEPGQMRTLLSHVALGALQEHRWVEAVALVGPWLAASRGHVQVHAALVEARELGGMPRVRDPLQRWSDLALYGRAALLTSAWVLLPVAALGLAGAGGLLVAGALQPVPTAGLLAVGVAVLLGLSLVAGVGMAGSVVGAQVVWAMTPGFLARRAAGPLEQPPVDARLRAQRRKILTRPPA